MNVDRHGRSGRQPPHALEDRVRSGDIAKRKETRQRARVDGWGLAERRQDGLGLRPEEHLVAAPHHVERLLADTVARQDEPLTRSIPDGHGKHSAHAAEGLHALARVQMRDDLRVAGGRASPARARQLIAQFDVVVDLAVLRDGDGPVVDRDRLVPARHVDDAQARRADRHDAVHEVAEVVRPAMADRLHHRRQSRLLSGSAAQRDEACNAAHDWESADGRPPLMRASSSRTNPVRARPRDHEN
jgi:hypothetical protein